MSEFRHSQQFCGQTGLTQITFQQTAPRTVSQSANGFLLDLADTFARQIEAIANLLQRLFLFSNAEEHANDFLFAGSERVERAVDFLRERFVDERAVGHGAVVVHQHVEQRVVLAFHKGSIDADVASLYLQRVGNFVNGQTEFVGNFLRTGSSFVLLFLPMIYQL